MDWLKELALGASVPHFIMCLGLVVALGVALGRVKVCGVSLRVACVLLVGIAVSHFGMRFPAFLCVDADGVQHFIKPEYTRIVQDFGLILFLYAVGLQSGKSFFRTFRSGGLTLNLLAVSVVLMDVAIAIAIHYCVGLDMPTVVGVLSGAVTNTPGLGAAQTIYQGMGNDPNLLASAYAAAYPLGVIGVILTFLVIRFVFRIDIDAQNELLKSEASSAVKTSVTSEEKMPKNESKIPPLIPIFVGILLGALLGSVPIPVPGIPQPLKLGIAGGALVVAILLSAFGEKLRFPTNLAPDAVMFMRSLGVCLFLACVGLRAGESFVETICNGGLVWVGLGAIITVVPLMIVGFVGYAFYKIDYFSLAGVLAGCMTDPPALSYACGTFRNERPAVSYAAVNPLSMFLRIVTAQLLLILFA